MLTDADTAVGRTLVRRLVGEVVNAGDMHDLHRADGTRRGSVDHTVPARVPRTSTWRSSSSSPTATPSWRAFAARARTGAQAGEARLAEVFAEAGFGHWRRAAESPFNLVLEARA